MLDKLTKSFISSALVAFFFIEVRPAFASKKTDELWQQALTGREISNTRQTSSTFGSTSTYTVSSTSVHFCSGNKIVVNGAFTVGGNVSYHKERPLESGTWKIVKSDNRNVFINFGNGSGAG